jgi:hypothetical protein
MEVQIININNKHSSSINKAIKLLNLAQTDFHFKLIERGNELEILKREYLAYNIYSKGETDSVELKEVVEKYFKEEEILYISIISEFLIGETYTNLFSEIIIENGVPTNYSFITDYNVETLLKGIPFEIYFIYTLLRYSIFHASKQYIAHTEVEINYCIFDYLIDKSHITNIFKTGNMCLDCQVRLDNSLNLNQIFSINSILRIVGRIARSKEPNRLFQDYLYLSENLKNERETNKSLLQDREIIEAIIANISRVTTNLIQSTPSQINNLKPLIGKGDFNEVFDSLISYTTRKKMTDRYNEIILLKSRYYRLETDIRGGIINSENKELRMNQISKSLIEFIDIV